MADDFNDIDKARRKKRDKSGWTTEEIKRTENVPGNIER